MSDQLKKKRRRGDRPMRFLPVGLNVNGKKVFVIGGGRVALQKLRTILIFGPRVTVVAPEILPEIEELGVNCVRRSYAKNILKGAYLVYACTSEQQINRMIAKEAKSAGILCNVADDTEACAFISPAVAIEGDLVFSVNSQGRNPKLARQVRDFLKEKVYEFLHGRD